MQGLSIGWLSFSPQFENIFINKLSQLGCDNLCLIDNITQNFSCLLFHCNNPFTKDYNILLASRNQFLNIPAIMISNASSFKRTEFLKEGMDDVVSPNIHIGELYERIIHLNKRYNNHSYIKHFGPFRINSLERHISFGGVNIPLKPREYLLLDYLLRHSAEPISRMKLLTCLWNCQHEPGTNSVEVHIWRLRQKLKEYAPNGPQIKTVRKKGYQIITHKNVEHSLLETSLI